MDIGKCIECRGYQGFGNLRFCEKCDATTCKYCLGYSENKIDEWESKEYECIQCMKNKYLNDEYNELKDLINNSRMSKANKKKVLNLIHSIKKDF